MNIIEPQYEAKSKNYTWDGLIVKQSINGKGVFATKVLKKFTMIPIMGKVIDKETQAQNNHSHYWKMQCHGNHGTRIDGHPSVNNNNLNIAMMINEPNKGAPNCIFWKDMVVVIKTVKPDTELVVWYGELYPRAAFGYKLLKSVTNTSRLLSDKILESKSFETFDNRLKTKKNKKILADLFQKHLKEVPVYTRNDTNLPKKYLKDVLKLLAYKHNRPKWLIDIQKIISKNCVSA